MLLLPIRLISKIPLLRWKGVVKRYSAWIRVFHLLVGAHSNERLLEIERELAPRAASHWNNIHTNPDLFRRIDALMQQIDTLGLDPEQKRVLERYHITFRRAGAGLDGAAKERLAEIIERLAALGTTFSQNVLADEQAFTLSLEGEAELAGLPDFMRQAMKSEAQERGLDGHVVTLSRSSVEPFLQFRSVAICAKRSFTPSSPAATMAARPTTRRSLPKW